MIQSSTIQKIIRLTNEEKSTLVALHFIMQNFDPKISSVENWTTRKELTISSWESSTRFKLIRKLKELNKIVHLPVKMIEEKARILFESLHSPATTCVSLKTIDDSEEMWKVIHVLSEELKKAQPGLVIKPSDKYEYDLKDVHRILTRVRNNGTDINVEEALKCFQVAQSNYNILMRGRVPTTTIGSILKYGWIDNNESTRAYLPTEESVNVNLKLITEEFTWSY